MIRPEYVSVTFDQEVTPNGKREYTYLTDLELEADDIVVVDVNGVYKIAIVTKAFGILPGQKSKACKWIVSKVDTEQYKERMQKQALAQEIRNKLRTRRDEYEELMIYQRLANEDEEIKTLLNTLAELEGTPSLIGDKS